MVLLDNEIYVTNSCQMLENVPGCRVIPFLMSCISGQDFFITSLINLFFIFLTLFILFKSFRFNDKNSFLFTSMFLLNGIVAFPYFYAAAHSYVYTILVATYGLFIVSRFEGFHKRSVLQIILCAILLRLVRSEAPVYFIIAFIAYGANEFHSNHLTKNKLRLVFESFLTIFCLSVIFDLIIQNFIPPGQSITRNIIEGGYEHQFPRNSYYAVAINATFDYLKAFLFPYYMNFFGNYLDWFNIHISKQYQIFLYLVFTLIIILSSISVFKRYTHPIGYFLIALGIFCVPTFLISSLLRNQWYYPSRSLLGCFLSLPFLAHCIQSINKTKLKKAFILIIFLINLSSFFVHEFYHFKNEETLYTYERNILHIKHPTNTKMFSQKLFKENKFLKAAQILRETGRDFPPKGIYFSANHFFLWSENLYWSAAAAFFYKSPLTEEKVLNQLYKQPNYFGALACLQDTRLKIEKCLQPKVLKHLCNPIYKHRFGYTYYKPPRMKAEIACSKSKEINN